MSLASIKTKNAEVIHFKLVDGGARGVLQVAEAEKNIPFPIRRTMVISGVENGETRGAHGHKKFEQVIVCVRGSFVLGLDDGQTKQTFALNDPSLGIRIGPKLWHTMSDFSPDAVVLVLCADYHNEADYIRDYNEFLSFIRDNP